MPLAWILAILRPAGTVSFLKCSFSRLTLDKRLEWALSASIRSRTAFRRTVSIVESRLGQLRSASGSESNRAEERRRFGPEQLFLKLRAPKLYHAQNMSHLAEIYRLFPRRITAGFVIPISNSVGVFLRNVNSSMS